jgi:hypothetical protein
VPKAYNLQLQYHLYAPLGPHRSKILAYQKTVYDFFLPENIREDLQRKAEATLQVLPGTNPDHRRKDEIEFADQTIRFYVAAGRQLPLSRTTRHY